MITRLFHRIRSSTFFVNVLTLITGTTIAQAIPLALMPVLSRIYKPEDFAALAIYISIFSLISTLINLKYDLTIILPEKEEEAINLSFLSILIAFIISLITFIVILIFHDNILDLIGENKQEMSFWIYFIPISTLFLGIYNALSYWTVRKTRFKSIAYSKISQSVSMTFTQIALGALKYIPKGLLFGEIAGRISAVITITYRIKKQDKHLLKLINKNIIKKQLIRYKKFPLFTLPANFINAATNQAPIFIIGKFFGGHMLGSYSFMERVLAAPIALLGNSVLDVFKQRASEDYQKFGNCREIYIKTFKSLLLLSLIPAIIIFFFAPFLFKFVFGPEWEMAGEFAQIMSVLFIFRFTASPLSYVLFIAEKQLYDMIWQIVLFAVTILSFVIGIYCDSIRISLILFAISYSIMYVIYLYMSYKFAKGT